MPRLLIVVGAGRIGEAVIRFALKNKWEVVAIDKNKERCIELANKYDVEVINGNAARRDILEEAGLGEADALVATLEDDAANLLVTSLARNRGIKRVTSIVIQEESREMFEEHDIKIVDSPALLAGKHLFDAVSRPFILESMPLGKKAEVVRVKITSGSRVAGRKLKDIEIIRKKAVIVTIERGEKVIIPSGDSQIRVDDICTIVTLEGQSDKIVEILAGNNI